MVARVLERTGETMHAQGLMYKAVAQSVILYGRKIWVMTGDILKVLEGFHHWAAQRITGMMATHRAGRELEYTSVLYSMEATGNHPVGIYIIRSKTTIVERLA